ncbi:MAG: CHAP domain-containing protein [Bacteroidales bacterium]|nr:CHAP domain-containing protein [Bacteroidales bacterium]
MKRLFLIVFLVLICVILVFYVFNKYNFNRDHYIGEKIDSLDGVYVHFNGGVNNVSERNLSPDGYNIGLKYQCVEFVKRYYLLHYNHKMPDSFGHAKDYFDISIEDGQLNEKRNLIQFTNPSKQKPAVGDIVVFSASVFNMYGHVAIVADVKNDEIEIIQQNPGTFGASRVSISLLEQNELWQIDNSRVLGFLRMEIINN